VLLCSARAAKEKKFWERSKKLASYHRVLRKEGFEPSGSERPDPSSAAAAAPAAVPSLAPEVFATGAIEPMSLLQEKARQSQKQKKRARPEAAEGDKAAAGAAAGESTAAAAAPAASGSSLVRAPLSNDMPDFKRRRLAPKELAALKAEKAAAKALAQKQLEEQRAAQAERRRTVHAMHTEKTRKGQPVLGSQMQLLVEKMQKQKAAAAAAAASTKK